MNAEQPRGRLKLVFIALLFFGPLAAAALYYYAGGALHPEGRTNAGRLLQPIVNVEDDLGEGLLGSLTEGRSDGHWLLIYANDGTCDAGCADALYRMRQSRLMLGRDMTRLIRVFLHGDEAPDKVLSDGEHEGLIATKKQRSGGIFGPQATSGPGARRAFPDRSGRQPGDVLHRRTRARGHGRRHRAPARSLENWISTAVETGDLCAPKACRRHWIGVTTTN